MTRLDALRMTLGIGAPAIIYVTGFFALWLHARIASRHTTQEQGGEARGGDQKQSHGGDI